MYRSIGYVTNDLADNCPGLLLKDSLPPLQLADWLPGGLFALSPTAAASRISESRRDPLVSHPYSKSPHSKPSRDPPPPPLLPDSESPVSVELLYDQIEVCPACHSDFLNEDEEDMATSQSQEQYRAEDLGAGRRKAGAARNR